MGHPAAIFLHPPDPNYKCAICLDIFDDPVSLLRCGHTFCRSCLHSSLAQSGKKCPECRLQVDVGVGNTSDDEEEENAWGDNAAATEGGARNNNGNVVHSVRVIQSAIGNSMVRCRNGWLDENGELLRSNTDDNDAGANVSNGNGSGSGESNSSEPPPSSSQQQQQQCCNWTGPLSQWHIHSTHHCPVAQTTCPIPGCSHTSSRSSMKSHTGSSACIKAAVVSQVQSQMNGILSHLKRQMKKEVDRKLSVLKKEKVELEVRVQGELERGLELQEVNYGLRREVRGLKRRVAVAEGQRRSAMQLSTAVSSSSNGEQEEESEGTSGSDGRVARGGGRGGDHGDGEESSGKCSGRKQQKKRAKKQRRSLSFDVHNISAATAASAQQDTGTTPVQRSRQRALSMDAASFMASEEQEEERGGSSRRKKRKKSKKSKRRRVSNEPPAGDDGESERGRAVSTDGTDVGVRISG